MGGGGERSEQETETFVRPDNREGDLDERAAAADEEDKRADQGGHWITLLLSCLLLGSLRYLKYNKNIVVK